MQAINRRQIKGALQTWEHEKLFNRLIALNLMHALIATARRQRMDHGHNNSLKIDHGPERV